MTKAHQVGPAPRISTMNRTMPKIPALIMTPDMTAETGEGATGWARGSHTWSGTIPAFVPKPTTNKRNSASRVGPPSLAAAAGKSWNASEPADEARIAKAIAIAAVARWVSARYRYPARATPASGRGPNTRIADVRAMASQAKRNAKALADPKTNAMLARNAGNAAASKRDRIAWWSLKAATEAAAPTEPSAIRNTPD